MKYLQDDKLSQWTTALADVPIGHSRFLHGRLEAYSMKRVSSDKKYAAVLGEKYVEQIQADQEWAAIQHHNNNNNNTRQIRSVSADVPSSVSKEEVKTQQQRKRSQSAGLLEDATPSAPPSKRPRSCSLDEGLPPRSTSSASVSSGTSALNVTALGDFKEQGTRRLMTDLVLTLNAAFPDFDFASIHPQDFVGMTVKQAVRRINESLGEWAAADGQNHNLNEMWDAVDQSIRLKECDVYAFTPSEVDASLLLTTTLEDSISATPSKLYDRSPSSSSVGGVATTRNGGQTSDHALLWSFNYLFVNKYLKRILLFSCAEFMRGNHVLMDEDDEPQAERFVPFSDTDNGDFDLDPASNAAGGIPFSNHHHSNAV